MQGVTQLEKPKRVPENPAWNTRFKRYAFADGLPQELMEAFRDAESLVLRADMIKNSRSTTAGIFVVDGKKYFIKRSNVNTVWERIRRIGRLPRSTRNLLAAEKLTTIGIFTPKVYLSLETGSHLLPAASYLITEYYPRPMSAGENLADLLEYFGSAEKFADAVCAMIINMHCNSMTHGDLKMSNIMAVKDSDGKFKLGLFDLDGVLWHGSSCPEKTVIKELARLASSFCLTGLDHRIFDVSKAADYLRIWSRAYAKAGGIDYTDNALYRQRLAGFMPDYNIQEMLK